MDYISYLFSEKLKFYKEYLQLTFEQTTSNVIWRSSLRRVSNVCKQLTSLLVSRVSWVSPLA